MKTICPICDAQITLPVDTVATEIVLCSDCRNRLVVDEISKREIVLSKAPEVEEDWGE
jgi:alpha-aminoadipate carrier protein LysW